MSSYSAKKARRSVRQSHFRVAPTFQRSESNAMTRPDIPAPADPEAVTEGVAAVLATAPEAMDETSAEDIADSPTIVLTPDQIAQLFNPPASLADEYNYWQVIDAAPPPVQPAAHNVPNEAPDPEPWGPRADPDAPTIVFEIGTLLDPPSATAPTVKSAHPTSPPLAGRPYRAPQPSPNASWPRAPQPYASGRMQPGPKVSDPDGDFAKLRAQRLSHALPPPNNEPHELMLTGKLRQFWRELKPGLDRVLGRSHRAGVRGNRITATQTSAQLPAVHIKSLEEQSAPAIQRRSHSAKQLGVAAHEDALPALVKIHARAERAAQRLVDRIDERMGSAPPMQHILLGPGRIVIAFAPGISIRDAQFVIAATHARPLRRIVGYNAYLVLVPPGREARYAERFHAYHEVIGVHFGAPHPAQPA